MGKSVTAQGLANQGGPGQRVTSPAGVSPTLGGATAAGPAADQTPISLPLGTGSRARRAPVSPKTTAVKTPAAKAVTATAKTDASKPAGANKGTPGRASGALKTAKAGLGRGDQARNERRRIAEQSDVLVSAVISTYLLTHLHHVLQRAEFGAQQEGRAALAANYAQLRKVLCLDARTMEDASASGQPEDAPQAA